MKVRWVSVVIAVVLLGAASFARAGVNCALVRKNMERPGATVEDVATTMVIPEEEIRKCLEEEGQAEKESGEQTTAGQKDAPKQ